MPDANQPEPNLSRAESHTVLISCPHCRCSFQIDVRAAEATRCPLCRGAVSPHLLPPRPMAPDPTPAPEPPAPRHNPAETGVEPRCFPEHSDWVTSVAIAP